MWKSIQITLERRADEWGRVAILVGLVSIPFTIVLSSTAFSGIPIYAAGVIAGYYYAIRPLDSTQLPDSARAGATAGVAGTLPLILWELPDSTHDIVPDTIDFLWYEWVGVNVIAALVVLVLSAFGIGVIALVGLICGEIGGWLARIRNRNRTRESP